MTEQFLKPPARFSHGLLFVLCSGIALVIGAAVGQLVTVIIGFATAGVFLGGFWAFSRESWLFTVAGSIAIIGGGIGLVVTPVLAVVLAMSAPTVRGMLIWSAVPLVLVGGVMAVVSDLVPSEVMNQDRPALIALLYAGGIATGLFVTVTAVRLGLAIVFGPPLSSTLLLSGEVLLAFITLNGFTRFGSLAFLVGCCLWFGTRLTRLPFVRRAGRWLAVQWREGAAGESPRDAPAAMRQRAQRATAAATGAETDGPTATELQSDAPLIRDVLGVGRGWSQATRLAGVLLLCVGLVALIIGSSPDTRLVATRHPIGHVLRVLLGSTTAPQAFLGGFAIALIVLRLGHAVAWRAVHVDWSAHKKRLAYLGGGITVLLGAVVVARPLVAALLATPALHYVPVGRSGPVITVTEQAFRITQFDPAAVTVQRRSELFVSLVRHLVQRVGAPILGLGLLAVLVDISIVLLPSVWLGAASSRLSHPTSGIGLLFIGTVGGAVLGIPLVLAFSVAAVTLLAWDIHTLGASLAMQLDTEASTLRGELVHLIADLFAIGIVIGLTLVGAEAVRFVPVPDEQWQIFGALVLSFLAALLSFLVLGLRGDQ